MDFSLGKHRVVRSRAGTDASAHSLSAGSLHNLPTYEKPPNAVISLPEVDKIAIDRIKVLKKMEECRERMHILHSDFTKEFVIKPRLYEQMPLLQGNLSALADFEKASRDDQIGHFMLRLAFCRTYEHASYIINLESDLFKYRFHRESKEGAVQFVGQFQFIRKIELEEKMQLAPELIAVFGWSDEKLRRIDIYKVPFNKAADLLRKRKSCVLLKGGHVFLPFTRNKMASILANHLKQSMRLSMTEAYRNLAVISEENRLLPRLGELAVQVARHKRSYLQPSTDSKGAIHKQQLDELACTSYPPCMKEIHNSLRRNHHLRYGARRQYGQFLKEAGLPMEEQLQLIKEEFTKKIDSDKFDRQYGYDIRYIYGKEGRRAEMSGMACATIILKSQPGPLDCHGCPFAHLETALLTQRLKNCDISDVEVENVVGFSKTHQYDRACTRYFELVHKMEDGALGQMITHPNQYMKLSQEIHAGRRTTKKHIVIAEEVKPSPSQLAAAAAAQQIQVTTPISECKKPKVEDVIDELMQD